MVPVWCCATISNRTAPRSGPPDRINGVEVGVSPTVGMRLRTTTVVVVVVDVEASQTAAAYRQANNNTRTSTPRRLGTQAHRHTYLHTPPSAPLRSTPVCRGSFLPACASHTTSSFSVVEKCPHIDGLYQNQSILSFFLSFSSSADDATRFDPTDNN